MRAWLAQHGFALRDALGRFGHHLLPAVFNVVVIGVAVSLPLSLYVAVKNLGAVTGNWTPNRS